VAKARCQSNYHIRHVRSGMTAIVELTGRLEST
jgi:hypothetical protein